MMSCSFLRLALCQLVGVLAALPAAAQYQWDWATAPAGRGTSYQTASAFDGTGNTYVGAYLDANGTPAAYDFGNGNALPLTGQAAALVKYNSRGSCQWAIRLAAGAGKPSPIIRQITTDAAGNVVVAGICPDSTAFGGQVVRFTTTDPTRERQGFVGKLNAAGQWQWVTSVRGQWTGADGAAPQALATDRRGSIYVAGSFPGVLTAGSLTLSSGWPDQGLFVGRLSAAGQWLWARSPGGRSDVSVSLITDLKVDAAGEAYLVGTISDLAVFGADSLRGRTWSGPGGPGPGGSPTVPADVFIARIDTLGQWRQAHDLGFGYRGRLTFGASGGYYVAGSFVDYEAVYTSAAGTDTLRSFGGFVAGFGPQGQRLDLRSFQPMGQQGPAFLDVDADGTAYLVGTDVDTLRFGAYVVPASANRMFYVAGLGAGGQWLGVTEVTNAAWVPNPTLPPPTYLLDLQARNGTVTVSGQHFGTASFGPSLLLAPPSAPAVQAEQFFVARFSTGPLGLPAEARVAALQLWPNPAHGTVQVSGLPAGAPVQLVDALGRVVRTVASGTAATLLHLQGIAPGVYTVRGGAAVRKLVVE